MIDTATDGPARTRTYQPSPAVTEQLMAEGLINLAEAVAFLPRAHGKLVSTSSVFRWITRGKRGVHLEGLQLIGNGWFTSKAALARFASALTAREAG